jgi:CubicO group peptidase (beta-lactamase class C family)
MRTGIDEAFVQDIVRRMVDRRNVFSAVLRVESGDGSLAHASAAGEMRVDDRYFIASVTKLYVTAVVLRLKDEGRLRLDDRVIDFFPEGMLAGLHVLKGVDYTGEITVAHLMSNTSGLQDYFFGKTVSGKSAADELLSGKDEPWPLGRILSTARTLKPRFPPGQRGHALYSDTNYELLGAVIERVTGKPIAQVFRDLIFDELGLRDTYAFQNVNDDTPARIYYRSRPVRLPRYLASVTAEGGIVSTAEECMRFLKAFFTGRFFPREEIEGLKQWNLVLRPGTFLYGLGLEKIFVPRFLKPFFPYGEILGFWGQTAAFAWYSPQNDLYFTGTANQLGGPGHHAASQAILRILKARARSPVRIR